MSHVRIGLGVVVAAVTCMSVLTIGQERDRAKIADKYKWNLADIYPNEAAWRTRKDAVKGELAALRDFRGKLGSSPQTLASALETTTRLGKELTRLYVYASMLADTDTRVSETQGMQQEMQQIYAQFGAEASFIEPEVLKVGTTTVEKFIAAEPRLKTYTFSRSDICQRAPHTLSDAEEKILADAAPL